MKTKITVLLALLIGTICIAQQGINYKALLKDTNGNPLTTFMNVQFTIHSTSETGTIVYQEDHNYTTDANGLLILTIGTDLSPSVGVFEDLDWSADLHFLNTTITYSEGTIDLGTTQFMAVPYAKHAKTAANVTGLEALDEGNGIGWRLKGSNPAYYGNIGLGSVDLNISTGASDTRGASGNFSTAMGYNTTASGFTSTAMGRGTTASGQSSTAMGTTTTASGDFSTAMGNNTEAIGENSTAMGNSTEASVLNSTAMGNATTASGFSATAMGNDTVASGLNSTAMGVSTLASGWHSTAMGVFAIASGDRSTAMGWVSIASGENATAMGDDTNATGETSTAMGSYSIASGKASTAMGRYTIAPSFAETSIGAYNTDYTPNSATSWNASDRLFVVGNGDGLNNTSDAFTILKNGTTTINGSTFITGLLSVNGAVVVNSVQVHSDRRLKKDIEALPYGLKEILQLQPKAYNWKDRTQAHKSLGLIAQEVQPLIKEIVIPQDNARKTLAINYTELIPVLINAIKEQQLIIDSLETALGSQQTDISELKTMVQQLIAKDETAAHRE